MATWDLSHVCNLHHSSLQRWILKPLSKARIEPETSWILVWHVTAEPQWELLVKGTLNGNLATFLPLASCPRRAEGPWPRIKLVPQQWQRRILNLLGHKGTPKDFSPENTCPRSCTERPPLSPSTCCRKVMKEIKENSSCRGNHSFASCPSGPVG